MTFQSTLPRGERQTTNSSCIVFHHFNPRSHEGSDVKSAVTFIQQTISIHAPTRGATFIALVSSLSYGFQSTLPRGERQQRDQRHSRNCYFNPRSHEGSDYSRLWALLLHQYFNPRSHEGSDSISFDICTMTAISIHAPTRGATEVDPAKYYDQGISIHAPTRGATRRFLKFSPEQGNFNPRSHEGSDDSPNS